MRHDTTTVNDMPCEDCGEPGDRLVDGEAFCWLHADAHLHPIPDHPSLLVMLGPRAPTEVDCDGCSAPMIHHTVAILTDRSASEQAVCHQTQECVLEAAGRYVPGSGLADRGEAVS